MSTDKTKLWERFQKYYVEYPSLHLRTDVSRMQFDDDFFERMFPRMQKAFEEMEALERGAIANPDESRMVGHYWLRNPALAPTQQIRTEIENTIVRIKKFANDVHTGLVAGQHGVFKNLLLIGIGGSALGPQFVANALGHPKLNRITPYFFDNTDADGMERVLATIGHDLGATLCVVISKSGATQETRNGMLEAKAAYLKAGLEFHKHAISITRVGSILHRVSNEDGWLDSFPMWDWVGGRTSELSAVGLLPAALQGIDIDALLFGANQCDQITRDRSILGNPAAQLALMWFHAGNGIGAKNMVVLPYRDRLELFSRYLQQLVMESLGKELDREGEHVSQGLTVFGNKGATDQHSYLQQLRDGTNDFFAVFIEVLRGCRGTDLIMHVSETSEDYLAGFYLGTREALTDRGRESISITINEITPFGVGVLIALFERAVGFYASLVNVNAYHQPGVEAGKVAAARVIDLQGRLHSLLQQNPTSSFSASQIAVHLGLSSEAEHVFKLCERLVAIPSAGIRKVRGIGPAESCFSAV